MQQKYRVSIDRITVVGKSSRRMQLSEIKDILGGGIVLKKGIFSYERQKVNSDGELMRENGFIVEESHEKNTWRIDFNPNKAGAIEKEKIKQFIATLSYVHLTRIDVAFDVFNNPLGMKYRLYRKNVSERKIETFKGRSQSIETIYWGARSSSEQVRLYNKLLEQKKNKIDVDENIISWERLELQLRQDKISDWIKRVDEMLSELLLPNYEKLDKEDNLALFALVEGHVDWDYFDKRRVKHLREVAYSGFDRTLSDELKKEFKDNIEGLQKELNSYLDEYKIAWQNQ